MSIHQDMKASTKGKPLILGYVSDALGGKRLSTTSKSNARNLKSPRSARQDGADTEDLRKMEKKYTDLVASIQTLFIQVNNKYYNINDINEKLNRKQNEFTYQSMEPLRLVSLIKDMLDQYVEGIIATEEAVSNYKLFTDEENQDYIWLLQKSERDMRLMIRENQQFKLLIQNQEMKLQSSDKQIELLTQYTQKAMEEMKQEFSFAIDLLAERESGMNTLKEEIKRKNEIIRSLDEQLISVLILEHKIGYLGQKQAKEKTKIRQEFAENLKKKEGDLKASFQQDQKERDHRIEYLEQSIKELSREKQFNEKDLQTKLELLQKQLDKNNEQLSQKMQQIHKLQSQLVDNSHDQFLQMRAQHQFTK